MKIHRMTTSDLKLVYNQYKLICDENGKDDNDRVNILRTTLLKRLLQFMVPVTSTWKMERLQ